MTIEIWSDVVCPFCYIGKREFESAPGGFPHKRDHVQVEWKSFELDPNAPARSEHDMYGMLVSKYGGTRDDAKARVQGVVDRAKTVGLDYQMDKAVIGNSFDAHRLIQFAKTKGKGAEAEERLFKGLLHGRCPPGRPSKLVRSRQEIGLDAERGEGHAGLTRFTEEVRADEREAQQLGSVVCPSSSSTGSTASAARKQSAHFLGALEQAWKERSAVKP
jgi:predicted DsbA family dithiol-disulfide isomerase